jgi:Gas vesicle protein
MSKRVQAAAELVLDSGESTVLDVLDELLNKGVVADGDVTIGLAGVDLIYLRLSALLCAADRVIPRMPVPRRRPRRRGRSRSLKARR